MLETAGAGKGVYASQAWAKAAVYAVPMYLVGARGLVKMLLLRILGGLSDHGVGVNFKTKSVTQKLARDTQLPQWALIPNHIVAEESAKCFTDFQEIARGIVGAARSH